MEHLALSWKPRNPSPKLRAQLFAEGPEEVLPDATLVLGSRWAWLAPVMGCFLMLMVVSGTRNSQLEYLAGGQHTDWVSAVVRDQTYAAYVAAGFHSEQNALQKEPIAWTNTPRSTSRAGSVLLTTTNSPIN
jgi:hypothetical protein